MYIQGSFDVIVVGGGHAGTEAALAAARLGVRTLLITHNLETLGQMSCNPSIGGIGKSHLVKEIDALGGVMAEATDEAGIQFRILNQSKGPAVRSTRAQIDRVLYRQAIRKRLENQSNLTLVQQSVDDLLMEEGRATGVVTQLGVGFSAKAVVLTAGTFLAGLVHVGLMQFPAGRVGDPPATALARRLREMNLPVGRLKTGTPARLDGRTIDYSVMLEQPGDSPLPVFSFLGNRCQHPAQLPCWVTQTNARTHEIIRGGLDRSPLYTGVIAGVGPRYCPSIEDKVHRFAGKDSHNVFIEPEGLHTSEVYPNGVSTSLPVDVQIEMLRSIRGLENVHVLRPGYAIEYDFFDPRHLKSSLESKDIESLFFAGQVNGTTGYEEAGAQGLLAGVNAALKCRDRDPWCPGREQAYIGVMVDDLITRGVAEPYRMFTSRAEYRLSLREDNADLRLTEIGRDLGLVDEKRWQVFSAKKEAIEKEKQRLRSSWVNPRLVEADRAMAVLGSPLEREANLWDLLRRPNVKYQDLQLLTEAGNGEQIGEDVAEQLEIQAKYQGYVDRQLVEVARGRASESLQLPSDLDYSEVRGLSNEVRQKLSQHRPETLGQASRIQGVTPAAISLLLVYLKRRGLLVAGESL